MSIFDDNKIYKEIYKAIKLSECLDNEKVYLKEYIDNVKENLINNDFYDLETLKYFIYVCLTEHFGEVHDYFNKVVDLFKMLLPDGLNNNNFKVISHLIITNGYYLDVELFTLFSNLFDVFNIGKIIKRKNIDTSIIIEFATKISPYTQGEEILKYEIISFIESYENILDISEFINEKLEEAKKRCGIYPVDEKKLALIASQIRKTSGLITRLENLSKKVDNHKEVIDSLVKLSKKEIDDHASNKVFEMKENIEDVKNEMVVKLDEYLLILEEQLKNNSDVVFNKVLEDASKKLREIRLAADMLGTNTANDLIKLQKASEESISKLKDYVENEPNLREILKSASESESVKKAILELGKVKEKSVKESVVLQGYDRVIVPATPSVILPHSDITPNLIESFDENIPFDVRIKKILDEKRKRESNGEIFHHLVDEVIACVMEGDWVYLWGPSGCGKSHIIKQVASLIGIDLVENGKITDKYSIMAYNDPHGRFRATQAFVALVYGKLLSLDEFDNGNTDTQVVLNELYSGLLDKLEKPNKDRFVTFAEDMTVKVNPNFRMISAGNTSGEGENPLYSSRGKLDESVLERMTPKRFDYDNRVEELIFGNFKNWYNLFVNFRKVCDDFAKREDLSSAPGMVTTRDASAIVKYIKHNSKSVDQIISEKFTQIKSSEYLGFIASGFKSMYGINEVRDIEINIPLDCVDEKTLAKKLVYACTRGKK